MLALLADTFTITVTVKTITGPVVLLVSLHWLHWCSFPGRLLASNSTVRKYKFIPVSLSGTHWSVWQSRAEQKLTAGNQPARSHLASGLAGTNGHIFVQCQDLCFGMFFLSLILLIDKGGGGHAFIARGNNKRGFFGFN
jgi:hypothetical protein